MNSWPIGTIVGAAELAKDNKIINHIKAAIVDIKDLLDRDGKELIADTHLAADLGAIDVSGPHVNTPFVSTY